MQALSFFYKKAVYKLGHNFVSTQKVWVYDNAPFDEFYFAPAGSVRSVILVELTNRKQL